MTSYHQLFGLILLPIGHDNNTLTYTTIWVEIQLQHSAIHRPHLYQDFWEGLDALNTLS